MGIIVPDNSLSLDGYIAGPNDHPSQPFGDGGAQLHAASVLPGDGIRLFAYLAPAPSALGHTEAIHLHCEVIKP